jgi:hypothetical protein
MTLLSSRIVVDERQQHRGVDLGGCQRNATRSAQKPQSDSQRGVNKVERQLALEIVLNVLEVLPWEKLPGVADAVEAIEIAVVCATSQPSKPLRESNSRAAVGMLVARTRNCRGGTSTRADPSMRRAVLKVSEQRFSHGCFEVKDAPTDA